MGLEEKPLVINGRPKILKNNKQILKTRDGRPFIASSTRVQKAMKAAIEYLKLQWGHRKPINIPVSLQIMSYGAWKSDSGNIPDASNLYEFPQDALEAAGIIKDDRLVEHHDGSRRIPMCATCHKRGTFSRGPNKGQRKPDCGQVKLCPYERTEIFIRDARDAEGVRGEAQG
jgi:Holliday junction resolvase RusA-like endonuclease